MSEIKSKAVKILLCPSPYTSETMFSMCWSLELTIAQTLLRAEFYRYLITYTDYFSIWPEAQAVPLKCAAGRCKNFVLSFITRFEFFQICISDQGREFVNEIIYSH